jgi:hypothetical protein
LKSAVTALIGDVLPATEKALNTRLEVGVVMVKRAGFELPPPGPGLTTVMLAAPGADTFVAGTTAVNFPALTNVVARGAPFQSIVEPEINPAPWMVNVNAGAPGVTTAGTSG